LGGEHARRYLEQFSYCESAPVPLHDYFESIRQQSLSRERLGKADLERALDGLLIRPAVASRILQAMRAGRGIFLHGSPGNGKTSVAERIIRAYGQSIWIPRAINIEGEIVRLYDPCCHEELPFAETEVAPKYDTRWIRIRRPTVIVGGELTLDRLDVTHSRSTQACEAPVQMKSNGGVLVIDDFGRQRVEINDLLNRWIIPLEKRYDFVNLPSGRSVQVPFEQLIIFSTNLEPRQLLDEAFLRRIAYKIEMPNPTEDEFRELFRRAASEAGFPPAHDAIDQTIARHFVTAKRPMRCCYPRDLVRQAKCYCEVEQLPLCLTREALDAAIENYFSGIS
jgi:predicted ATPase with chaperone activity